MLARALLCKSDSLSAKEIRFLRRAAGIRIAELAERLEVSSQTVQNWETLPVLGFVNEVATRVVIRSLIVDVDVPPQFSALPEMIRKRDAKPSVIRVEWLGKLDCWKFAGC